LLHQIEEAARAQHRQPAEVLEDAWKRYQAVYGRAVVGKAGDGRPGKRQAAGDSGIRR
jgi:hypothetical protein